MAHDRLVSVVIPTYQGQRLLAEHLPAVFACVRAGDEIVIVDDASPDETVAWLCQAYHLQEKEIKRDYTIWAGKVTTPKGRVDVKLIQNHRNVRFAAAANRGVELASRPYIFLLNSDVSPHKKVLAVALPYFDDPQVFAVACLEREAAQKGQPVTGGKGRLWFEKGLFHHGRASNYQTGPTAWANGGSSFFDRSKWLSLGGFSSAFYPAYWEDIDLSWRAQQRGWQVLFVAEAQVDHHHETTNTTVFGQQKIAWMSWRNGVVFTWRHANVVQRLQFLAWLPYNAGRFWRFVRS